MRELTSTSDLSYAESVRIALEAHGIGAVVQRPNVSFYAPGGPAGGITISITHDADYERARAVMSEVVESANPMSISRGDVRRGGRFLLKAAIVAVIVAAIWYWRRGS